MKELIFFITYKCNFKCDTCFYAGTMNSKTLETDKELTCDEIDRLSSSLGRLNTLFISGGEPFLREDLPEICGIFCLQNNVRNIHLPTNGFYTEKIYDYTCKILRKCPGINLTVSLSLDGLKETHDKIKGVQGSFEKVIETIKRLVTLKKEFKNLSLYIISVVNNKNLGEMVELAEFIKNNLPVDGHGPSPLRGNPYDKALLPPSYEEWDDLSKKLIEYHSFWNRKKRGGVIKALFNTNRVRYLYSLYTHVLKNKRLPFRCQAGKAIAVLEPNGDIRHCELTEVAGNIRSADYDFQKVLASERADAIRKNMSDCACTHACFLNPSIKSDPASLFKSYLWGKV